MRPTPALSSCRPSEAWFETIEPSESECSFYGEEEEQEENEEGRSGHQIRRPLRVPQRRARLMQTARRRQGICEERASDCSVQSGG